MTKAINTMMLNIISGVENSPFLLIKDCYEHSGFALFKVILNYHLQNGRKPIELYCYEYSPVVLMDGLNDSMSKINVHDGYTDPLEWDSSLRLNSSKFCSFNSFSNLQNIYQSSERILMIDSLSYILLNMPVHEVYKTLNVCLKRNVPATFDQIIACVHSDVHEEVVISKIEHLATSVLNLSADSPTICTIVHKKLNGKIVKEVGRYFIEEDFSIRIGDTEIKSMKNRETRDPTADLTFNLRLTDDERIARQHLVLPYVKCSATVTEGTIYYEPDDDDSEDPDDDLDI